MVASYTTAFKIKINSKKRQNPLSYLLRLFTSCGKNYAVLSFFAQKTCFRLFATKLRCFELNLTENNVFAFLLIHYAVFSFMVPKTCFCLLPNYAVFNSFPCLQLNVAFYSPVSLHTTFVATLQLFYSVFRVKHKFVQWVSLDKLVKFTKTVRVAVLKLIELTYLMK